MRKILLIIFICGIQSAFAISKINRWKNPTNLSHALYKVEKIECFFRPNGCITSVCKVKFIDRYTQHINIHCYTEDIHDDVYVHVVVYYRFTKYRKFLIDLDINICEFMKNPAKNNPFLSVVVPYVESHSKTNLIHPCPYTGHLNLTDFVFDYGVVQHTIMPAGQYRVDLHFYEKKTNETIALIKGYGTAIRSYNAADDFAMG